MRPAEDAVHTKALLAQDMSVPLYRTLMRGFMDSDADPDIAEHHYTWEGDADHEVDDMIRTLQGSDNYYVSPSMVEFAQTIAPTMPDEDLLAPDVPATSGWMWLGRPYRMIDVRRKALSMNALLWVVRGNGVKVWHFTHKTDMDDSVNYVLRERFTDQEWQRVPMMSVNHVMYLPFDRVLPRGLSWDNALPPDAKVELSKVRDEHGNLTGYQIATDHYIDNSEVHVVRSPLCEFVLCLWRLCQQSLATVTTEHPSRAVRHRVQRANLPDKPISVITLRRIDHEPVGESTVEWTHRWLVSGHWRSQPYKEDGATIYRQIYIHSYLKGPEDKPILIRKKVRALVR